ncbi:MAG TPA: NAD(P)/FAD-dependent oxidoreductase [Terriglobales bacterium]|nr:NAD(P)/FAD-dependent oxidoreductase [Terriglobales bacterium]
MKICDVLIVGGGPAGSSCAWALRGSGLDVLIIDKQTFPRDKVCGGWITPQIMDELQLDPADYARGRAFQPICGFRTSRMGDPEVETNYGRAVSYGIRRFEFDDYLLKRCGVPVLEGVAFDSMERQNGSLLVNGEIKARLVVGAGGHFCPVARQLGAKMGSEEIVVAQEAEFEMDARQQAACSIKPEMPELYFCADMRGYGWCFRKANVLNVGLGRLDRSSLSRHVAEFLAFLRRTGKVAFELPASILGHAYLIYSKTTRKLVDDGVVLIGDAAGLAYSQSGEGIRPAIESGLLAAGVISDAAGDYPREKLEPYVGLLRQRYGHTRGDWATAFGRRLSPRMVAGIARRLLRMQWFAKNVVMEKWFLHMVDEPVAAEKGAGRQETGVNMSRH